jgi:hypothetical protein
MGEHHRRMAFSHFTTFFINEFTFFLPTSLSCAQCEFRFVKICLSSSLNRSVIDVLCIYRLLLF